MVSQVNRGGLIAMGVSIAAMIGSSMVARSIPYTPGVGAKQAAWLAHCAVVGAVIAPICLLGGPILTRAAWYTAGMVGGLSTVAVCAPSDKFLYMGGPLAMGLGVVFCASIASNFLPPTTALGAGMYSIAVYGGLVLVSDFHVTVGTYFTTSVSIVWPILKFSFLVWRLLAVRHPESYPQGRNPPCPLWRSSLRPRQRLHRHLHGHRQHLHQDCHDACWGWQQEEVNPAVKSFFVPFFILGNEKPHSMSKWTTKKNHEYSMA